MTDPTRYFATAKALRSIADEFDLGSPRATDLYRLAAEVLSDGLSVSEVGQQVDYCQYTPTLYVASKGYYGPTREAVVTLTQDGGYTDVTQWHTGPESGLVYYERWRGSSCEAHGHVDAKSRKLVQVG